MLLPADYALATPSASCFKLNQDFKAIKVAKMRRVENATKGSQGIFSGSAEGRRPKISKGSPLPFGSLQCRPKRRHRIQGIQTDLLET